MLDLNNNLGEYVNQLITEIIPTIIRSQYLDILSRCILNLGLQFYEFFQDFRLLLIKNTHVYLENSSMKFRMYLDPFMDVICMGPLISECISPKMHDARISFPRSNLCSGCFPTTQPLQIPVVAFMIRMP